MGISYRRNCEARCRTISSRKLDLMVKPVLMCTCINTQHLSRNEDTVNCANRVRKTLQMDFFPKVRLFSETCLKQINNVLWWVVGRSSAFYHVFDLTVHLRGHVTLPQRPVVLFKRWSLKMGLSKYMSTCHQALLLCYHGRELTDQRHKLLRTWSRRVENVDGIFVFSQRLIVNESILSETRVTHLVSSQQMARPASLS